MQQMLYDSSFFEIEYGTGITYRYTSGDSHEDRVRQSVSIVDTGQLTDTVRTQQGLVQHEFLCAAYAACRIEEIEQTSECCSDQSGGCWHLGKNSLTLFACVLKKT